MRFPLFVFNRLKDLNSSAATTEVRKLSVYMSVRSSCCSDASNYLDDSFVKGDPFSRVHSICPRVKEGKRAVSPSHTVRLRTHLLRDTCRGWPCFPPNVKIVTDGKQLHNNPGSLQRRRKGNHDGAGVEFPSPKGGDTRLTFPDETDMREWGGSA